MSVANVEEFHRPNFNTDHVRLPAVVQRWENYLADKTADALDSLPGNIREPKTLIKDALFSGVIRAFHHVPKRLG